MEQPDNSLPLFKAGEPYQEIAEYIANFTGYPLEKITLKTRINEDIKIAGDDAAELIKYFAIKHKISLKQFNFDDYFYPEGLPLFPRWSHIRIFLRGEKIKKDFTVGDIIRAIETKVLA